MKIITKLIKLTLFLSLSLMASGHAQSVDSVASGNLSPVKGGAFSFYLSSRKCTITTPKGVFNAEDFPGIAKLKVGSTYAFTSYPSSFQGVGAASDVAGKYKPGGRKTPPIFRKREGNTDFLMTVTCNRQGDPMSIVFQAEAPHPNVPSATLKLNYVFVRK